MPRDDEREDGADGVGAGEGEKAEERADEDDEPDGVDRRAGCRVHAAEDGGEGERAVAGEGVHLAGAYNQLGSGQ